MGRVLLLTRQAGVCLQGANFAAVSSTFLASRGRGCIRAEVSTHDGGGGRGLALPSRAAPRCPRVRNKLASSYIAGSANGAWKLEVTGVVCNAQQVTHDELSELFNRLFQPGGLNAYSLSLCARTRVGGTNWNSSSSDRPSSRSVCSFLHH